MSDTPALPPVGELVQITDADVKALIGVLGKWEPGGFTFRTVDGDRKHYQSIRSWCRVLVVPDSDDTQGRLAAAIVGQRPEHWARSRQLAPKVAALTWQQAGRALAALREAAIR